MRIAILGSLVAVLLCSAAIAHADIRLLRNPTPRAYPDAAVRLRQPAIGPAGTFVVKANGDEVPYQVERIGGTDYVWVCRSFEPGTGVTYDMLPRAPKDPVHRVKVARDGDCWLLDNGQVAVKVPAVAGKGVPGPIAALKVGDRWLGASSWQTKLPLKAFSATVVGDGTIVGKVRLRYDFDGKAGYDHDIPAFSEIDVTLAPGWSHVQIAERHEMGRGDWWEFAAAAGWTPRTGISIPYSAGPGSGSVEHVPNPQRPLLPIVNVSMRPDLFINLLPRWNQHYKDGWAFSATDGKDSISAVTVRAGQWVWPHDNSLEVVVKPAGDYAGIRARTWHGSRCWWLAPSRTPAEIGYVTRYAFEDLDKLNHDFILDWPGMKPGWWGMNYYDGGQVNPTGSIRAQGRAAADNAGKPGTYADMIRMQAMLHPDSYGDYWHYWSPENPNFLTDFVRIPIALATNLKAHPEFARFRELAELKVREEVYHAMTLPGGAGQECPGYQTGPWPGSDKAILYREHLGFDPGTWPEITAAARFKQRISWPYGDTRRGSTMGDSHPSADGARVMNVPADLVKTFVTEELPGYGVVFTNNPGTPKETYLAFKAGPNRGHFHGDQLAFHYCGNGNPLLVDHHCSYHPRAGQDHMHNRLAFFTDDFPYANMDGYERLIAFKTGPAADVAVGQVESNRLRQMRQLPPEDWDTRYPELRFDQPLVYRRTVVCVKGGAQDYFVFRDQYWADRPLKAAYCLHALDDRVVLFSSPRDAGGTADGTAVFRDEAADFAALGVKPGMTLCRVRAAGANAKETDPVLGIYRILAVAAHALTLDRPVPAGAKLPYAIARDLDGPADGRLQRVGGASVFRAWPAQAERRAFPWWHTNGKLETTQGLRWESQGKTGEFITVVWPGADTPAMTAIPGGVQVGNDRITFAGDRATDGTKATVVTVQRGGKDVLTLGGADINLERNQGRIGLFVPDAGYPVGDIPDWLIKQRATPTDWYKPWPALGELVP